jgi:hypothetical protein
MQPVASLVTLVRRCDDAKRGNPVVRLQSHDTRAVKTCRPPVTVHIEEGTVMLMDLSDVALSITPGVGIQAACLRMKIL